MSKYVDQVLFDFATEFAQYHDDDGEPYWWGHDTNLGSQTVAFTRAKKRINKYKREHIPTTKNKTAYATFPPQRRKQIAEAIFGKGKVPSYWNGSRGEADVLTTLARVKNVDKLEQL